MAGAIAIYSIKRWATLQTIRWIGIGIGAAMILQEFFSLGMLWIIEKQPVLPSLPLHLCGLAIFTAAILLITHNYFLFELTYFWGLAGATIALLTPDLSVTWPHSDYIMFFSAHFLIIFAVVFMIVMYDYRPTFKSVIKTFLITQAYMLLMIPFNFIFNTNFLYLRHKPLGSSILDFFGPWPWYIVGMEVIGIALLFVLVFPYSFRD